jgi:hypothetical protein
VPWYNQIQQVEQRGKEYTLGWMAAPGTSLRRLGDGLKPRECHESPGIWGPDNVGHLTFVDPVGEGLLSFEGPEGLEGPVGLEYLEHLVDNVDPGHEILAHAGPGTVDLVSALGLCHGHVYREHHDHACLHGEAQARGRVHDRGDRNHDRIRVRQVGDPYPYCHQNRIRLYGVVVLGLALFLGIDPGLYRGRWPFLSLSR